MEDDIRRRSACDRCHSQKLRCPKRQVADVCDRCAKAGSSCRYSPFRQKKDPERFQNNDIRPVDSHGPIHNKNTSESNESRKASTVLNAHKRKRIAPPSLEADLDLELGFYGTSAQTSQEQTPNSMGSEWCSSPLPAFHDLSHDSTFGDMNFENQSEYSPLEFDLQSFPNFRDPGDKMNSLLQLRSPPPTIDRSIDGSPFRQPFSPLPDTNLSPPHLAVTLQTSQLPVWAVDVRRHQQSISQCIRQLSDLSVRLYEHSATIPPQSIHDAIPENESYADVMNARAKDYAYYKVDDTFQLTQELIDIYPSFINIFTRRKISQASHSSHTPTNFVPEKLYDQSGASLRPIAPSFSNPLALDHSSILLVLSCHLRLIEIYDELFKHMQVCIDQKGPICASQQSFNAPQLRIGNYVPPLTTSTQMQVLLLLHFATSLCDHAVELEKRIQEPGDGIESSPRSPNGRNVDGMTALSLASAEKVKDRAAGMLQRLSSLRTLMLREGIIA